MNQFCIQPSGRSLRFAATGDSGSLIVSEDGANAVGLLFAEAPEKNGAGIASPMGKVLELMEISLIQKTSGDLTAFVGQWEKATSKFKTLGMSRNPPPSPPRLRTFSIANVASIAVII